MAPTIQAGHSADRDKRQRPTDKKSELVCRMKYCNTLPDIPFDPKFITYPFESNRFVQYNPTSLEKHYKHDLLTEHDLGVTIDLIDSSTYAVDPLAVLDPMDEKLLEEEIVLPQDSKRSRHHKKSVSWLRRTEYISTEYARFQPSSDKTETKVGYNVKRFFKEQDLYMDRESQIKAIDKTFDDFKLPIEKHHTKPHVAPVEVLPVFPDFEMWKYPCAQVIFDSDPAPSGRPFPVQMEEMSQAMIRGVMDESGEQFVAYFLPTEDTLVKRKRDVEEKVDYKDEEEYEYKMAREYNWNVKNKASKGYEENYFFVFRETGVYYNELETRVRLSKRRLKPGTQPNNSRLVVGHRPLNEVEFKTQEIRMLQLEPMQEEEGEEEEEEEKEQNNEPMDTEENTEAASPAAKDEEPEDETGRAETDSEGEAEKSPKQVEHSEEEEEEAAEEGDASSSKASSGSEEASASEKSSDEESEAEEDKKRRDEEEIFGSGSDSDSY